MQATATSPLVKEGKSLTRRFLGNIKPQNTMEQKEYKAYLKGNKYFTFGKDHSTYPPSQNYYAVRQEYFYQ